MHLVNHDEGEVTEQGRQIVSPVDEEGLYGLRCDQENAGGDFDQIAFGGGSYVPMPLVNRNLRQSTEVL